MDKTYVSDGKVRVYDFSLRVGEFDSELFRDYLLEFKKGLCFASKGDNLKEYNGFFSSFKLNNAPEVLEFLKATPECRKEHDAFARTFAETMKHLYALKEWDRRIFMDKTLLSPELYSRTQKEDSSKVYAHKTLVSIIIPLDVGYETACRILELQGYILLRSNIVQGAYDELLQEHAGAEIEDCNNILMNKLIKKTHWLGDKSLPAYVKIK